MHDSPSPRIVALATRQGEARGGGYALDSSNVAANFTTLELPLRSGPATPALRLLRSLFLNWGLDRANQGTDHWNPLGSLIPTGSKVVIKPNWVFHTPQGHGTLDSLITHTSVIQAVLEYLALTRPTRIIVGDAPVQGCDFDVLRAAADLDSLSVWATARGVPLEILDFRRTVTPGGPTSGLRRENARSLDCFVRFDLGNQSALQPLDRDSAKFRVTAYDPDKLAATHQPGRHQYLVAREVLDADVVINMPKLKCHCKACITGALKNLVGINGHKEYLPHHRKGGTELGGDCYPGGSPWKNWMEDSLDTVNRPTAARFYRQSLGHLVAATRKLAALAGVDSNIEGAWYGNDTVWRTCFDLNRILKFGGSDARLHPEPQRILINITDAIVAGEGEGPLLATPVESGFLTGSLNAAAADYVHARLMGLDPDLIPITREAFANPAWQLADFAPTDIAVLSGSTETRGIEILPLQFFAPPSGWRGHCELLPNNASVETRLTAV